MNETLYGLIGMVVCLAVAGSQSMRPERLAVAAVQPASSVSQDAPAPNRYSQTLRYNIYTFSLDAPDSGAVRELTIKAHRGQLLLTNFRVRINGAVVGAEVADLDKNRFPELYVYTSTTGSNSFGGVQAWQFLPERMANVTLVNWRLPAGVGYQGQDSLWIERDVLCRRYPVYRPGDEPDEPSGGIRMMRYRLRPVGPGFALVADRN